MYVIPSLSRSLLLCEKSLHLLVNKYGVPKTDIYVFVIEEEYDEYRDACDGVNICIGPYGLDNMRNHIRMHFPIGTQLVCLDDDISDLLQKVDDKLCPLTCSEFHAFIRDAFETLQENGLKFFGIYPVRNAYFMKGLPYKSMVLRFCVGAFWGCINEHDEQLFIHTEEKEDFERTLLYYERDGGVLRYNTICPLTRYYKEKGGMQSRNIDRCASSKVACSYLLSRFPSYCRLYTSKKSGIYEVRLKDRSGEHV